MLNDVYIRGARRTPIGAFGGALSSVPAPDLAAAAIRGLGAGDGVGGVVLGNVLSAGVGQAPARQAALAAGLPDSVPAAALNKVCGSGMAAIIAAAREIGAGESRDLVAGGMENMSRAPHLLPSGRSGVKLGHAELLDSMLHDGLWDPYGDRHMGDCGELCAERYGFTREAQDAFAATSYRRAQAAIAGGCFEAEISPVTVASRRGETVVAADEGPAAVDFDKLPSLRPAFREGGTITAANASTLNDGAAALHLSAEPGGGALARIVAWGGHAGAPEEFTTAPVGAVRDALGRAGWEVADVDLWEINEAFSVVPMAVAQELDIDLEKTNVHGGAVSLGHPIGASGARIVVTLAHAMRRHGAGRGVAAICIGGGEGLALCLERSEGS